MEETWRTGVEEATRDDAAASNAEQQDRAGEAGPGNGEGRAAAEERSIVRSNLQDLPRQATARVPQNPVLAALEWPSESGNKKRKSSKKPYTTEFEHVLFYTLDFDKTRYRKWAIFRRGSVEKGDLIEVRAWPLISGRPYNTRIHASIQKDGVSVSLYYRDVKPIFRR